MPKKVKQHFFIDVIAWRYPIRILCWILTYVFLFPEMLWLLNVLFGISGFVGTVVALLISFMAFFGLVLVNDYIEYTKFPILLFEDHLEFRESIFLSENYKIPYRNIVEIKTRENFLQKRRGLKTIAFQLKSGSSTLQTRAYWMDLHDVGNAEKVADAIWQRVQNIHEMKKA